VSDINVKWTGGAQFLASDGAGHVVVTDRDGQGMKPPLLLLVSLAGCAGVDVVSILEKKRQRFTGIEVRVSKYNDPDPPWCIEKIEIEWIVRGHKLREKAVQDAVRLSQEKYCSVTASLTSELVTTVTVLNEDEGAD
jgi:putative redox protein